ncbi:unnamed protein product [Spirodela intermedia]|uniref:FHA domain-containing protein n=1 Tax=Spirodela intermedia TaxID=51605 RepID=A0A7I8KTD7_SPIIN|nr:unnamed protein product [Spirodela intermedia]
MGALAPLAQWTPEDDVQLKNAVEAGASLESLAKGAVEFSRRFTIREVKDRWRHLLYDQEMAMEASVYMTRVSADAGFSGHLKSGKNFSTRAKEWAPGKRKRSSVRSLYYAMQKRLRSGHFNSPDVDFLVPPSTAIDFSGNGGCREQSKFFSEHVGGDPTIGTAISDQFKIPKFDFGIGHEAFPGMQRARTVTEHADAAEQGIHNAHLVLEGNRMRDEVLTADGLFEFEEEVPPVSLDKGIVDSIVVQSFDHESEQNENYHSLTENVENIRRSSDVQDIRSPEKLAVRSPQETQIIEEKPLFSAFDTENDRKKPPFSSFGENQNVSSEVSDCSGSLQNIGFSSPLVSMSLWGGIDATPTLPMDSNFDGDGQRSTSALDLSSDGVKKMIPEAYDGVRTEDKLLDEMSMGALNDSAIIAESDFVNLSLNFPNEDELFLLNEEGKDIMDGPCLETLNSIFSDSPADIHQDNAYETTDTKNMEALMAQDIISDEFAAESKGLNEEMRSGSEDGHAVQDSTENINVGPSDNISSLETPERLMICTLNTEDPEVPCNDDIVLPNEVYPSVSSRGLKLESEVSGLVSPSCKVTSDDHGGVEEDETLMNPFISSRNTGLQMHAKVGLKRLNDDFRIKTEFQGIDSHRQPGVVSGEKIMLSSAPAVPLTGSVLTPKEEILPLALGKCGESINSVVALQEKSHEAPDHAKSNFQVTADVCEQMLDSAGPSQKWGSLPAELGGGDGGFADPSHIFSISDNEENSSDSDDDVPNFSDIEAMILDMDLAFSDQESSLFSREVSRYQFLESKKTLMRLEQGALSCVERSVASHGALAVFYGRRLKHYIKKPEVSLGRATDDVHVDIDLKREGPANKISRRQAIIKLDEHGSFYLKNTGKFPIVINGKEVPSGKQLNLSSGCLIEMRGMKFIFEVCHGIVSQYVANVWRKRRQEQNPSFSLVAT